MQCGKCEGEMTPRSPRTQQGQRLPRDTYVCGTALATRVRMGVMSVAELRVGTARVGGPRESKRPGFSNSGETGVNSDTAEQTALRIAL